MSEVSLQSTPSLRDPAWSGRLFWTLAATALLLPMLWATEFKPWILFEPDSLRSTLRFLSEFLPPRADREFLGMVAFEAWRTVAIATCGMVLALLLGVPLTLAATTVLSISALPGRMNALPFVLRQAVRWLLIVLRSVPELVWALVFVRVVGLGPTAGVLAIALTYSGMLGKVYAEILESGEPQPTAALLRNGSGQLHGLSLGVCDPLLSGAGLCRCGWPRTAADHLAEDVQWCGGQHHPGCVRCPGVDGRLGEREAAPGAGISRA
jgi:phosphonate transport system permease protein